MTGLSFFESTSLSASKLGPRFSAFFSCGHPGSWNRWGFAAAAKTGALMGFRSVLLIVAVTCFPWDGNASSPEGIIGGLDRWGRGQSAVVVEVYENQEWDWRAGWKLATSRSRVHGWTARAGANSLAPEEFSLPDEWEWVSEWLVAPSLNQNGWWYGRNLEKLIQGNSNMTQAAAPAGAPHARLMDRARRRRWVRIMCPQGLATRPPFLPPSGTAGTSGAGLASTEAVGAAEVSVPNPGPVGRPGPSGLTGNLTFGEPEQLPGTSSMGGGGSRSDSLGILTHPAYSKFWTRSKDQLVNGIHLRYLALRRGAGRVSDDFVFRGLGFGLSKTFFRGVKGCKILFRCPLSSCFQSWEANDRLPTVVFSTAKYHGYVGAWIKVRDTTTSQHVHHTVFCA